MFICNLHFLFKGSFFRLFCSFARCRFCPDMFQASNRFFEVYIFNLFVCQDKKLGKAKKLLKIIF